MVSVVRRVSLVCIVLWLVGFSHAFAQTLTSVHAFDGVQAANPAAGLTLGADGFLYGTTEAPAPGTIFRVRPDGSGYEVVHTFAAPEEGVPSHAPLALGPGNVLFGTTLLGGTAGRGTVYRLETRGTLVTVTTVHEFAAPLGYPDGGVIVGRDGLLYGSLGDSLTSSSAIYRLAQDGSSFQALHLFSTGFRPTGTLIESSDGFLYGTTERGGATDGGTVFRIRPDGTDFLDLVALEGHPVAGVTEAAGPDGALQLFGVETDGVTEATQYGAIFRVRKDGTDFQRIGLFTGTDRDGIAPRSPLLLGHDLNLYGTASDSLGCPYGNCGTVFRLSPAGTPFAVVALPPTSGAAPMGALVQAPDGAIYGTARTGGPDATETTPGHGVVFSVRRPATVPLEFTGPVVVDESAVAPFALVIRNTTNTTLTAPLEVIIAPSEGLTLADQSSDGWTCTALADGRLRCRWSSDLIPGADSDMHSILFTPAPPFASFCAYGASPCIHVSATLSDSGAFTRVFSTVRALVNGTLNSPPVAADDLAPVFGTAATIIRVLDNDTDPDGDTLRVARIVEVPRFGDVTINADGTITYTPSTTLLVPDTFRYEVDDQKVPTPGRSMAVVTINPSIPTLTQTKTRIDLGRLAVGRFAAGRLYLDSNVAMRGRIEIQPVTAAEIATALDGTPHDPAMAVSDTQSFAVQFNDFGIDPAIFPFSTSLTIYYQAPAAVGRVSVAKAVMTAEPDGLPPMHRQVLIVAVSADAASAPVRATDDFTATPVGTSVWYDVLANDAGPSDNGRPLYVALSGCVGFGSTVLSGGTCDVAGTLGGEAEGPASITGPQEIRIGPPATGTGTAVTGYAASELDDCVTSPQPNGVCRLEGNMYFAQIFTDVGGTTPDLSLALTPANATVLPGSSVTMTATVRNDGPGMASRVTVTGFAGITRLSGLVVVPSRGTCTSVVAGAPLTCALRNLSAGESVTITFSGIVDGPSNTPPNLSTVLTVTGSVQYGTTDSQPGNNTAAATIRTGLAADVSVEVAAAPATVAIGQPTTISVTVRNAGPDAATSVRLNAFDFLTGFHITGAAVPAGWSCQPLADDQPWSCQVSVLAAGSASVFTVTASPTMNVFTGTSGAPTFPANATVAAAEVDPQATNNVGVALVTVPRPPASVTVTAVATPAATVVGEDAVYDIEVRNTGVSDATQATLVIDLPPEIAVRDVAVTGIPSSYACSFSPPLDAQAGTPDLTINCLNLTLVAGTSSHIRLSGRLSAAPSGGVATFPVVVASNDCADVAPTLAGTQCAVTTIAVQQAVTTLRTQLIQTGAATPARVGDVVTFVARLTNTGTEAARQVTATVQLPPELRIDADGPVFTTISGCSYPLGLLQPGTRIDCVVAPLAPGASTQMTMEMRVLAVPAAPAAAMVFRASSLDCLNVSPVAGGQCDSVAAGPVIARAAFTRSLTFERPAGTSSGAPIRLGDTLVARATVTNTSAIDARNPYVRLTFPSTLGVAGLLRQPGLSGATFTPSLSRGVLGTPSVTIDLRLPTLVAGATATTTVDLRALGIPANGLYEATMEFGSRDCYDLTADGQSICDSVTGSIDATPGPTGTIGLGGSVLGLSTNGGLFRSIEGLPGTDVPPPPAGLTFPYGAMAFEVYDVPVGGTIAITMTTPAPVSGYWKVTSGAWSRFAGGVPGSGGLVLTLTDGGAGDADGLANGVIVDPGALGVSIDRPTANAGADLVAEATSPAGAQVTLVGAGVSSTGGALTFAWSGACGTAATATATVACPFGSSTMTLTVTNSAGTSASDQVQVTVRDTTPPSITIASPVDGATYLLNQAVLATYTCADSGAGVESCRGTIGSGSMLDTSAPGTRTIDVTATDAAGHTVTVSRRYTVQFASGGRCFLNEGHVILPPIDPAGSSVFPKGLPVLARFRVCDAQGTPVSLPGVVTGFRLVRASVGGVAQPLDSPVPSLLQPARFQWEPFTRSWLFIIDTRHLASRTTTYDLLIALSDGSSIPFRFTVR